MGNSPSGGQYKFWCKDCGHNYYSLGSETWYKAGDVTVYPKYGYCGICAGKGHNPGWSWWGTGTAKIECRGCTNLIGVVSWSDWRNRNGERTGYCNGCAGK